MPRRLKDAGHRLKTLFTTFLSRSQSPFNLRRRKHVKANANTQGLKSSQVVKPDPILAPTCPLSPPPQSQFVLNNLVTIVQPPSPPTAVDSSDPTSTPTPTPTPNPGGDPLTHGLNQSGRPNLPSRLVVHTQGAQDNPDTHLNLTPGVSECPTPRPPHARALLIGVHYKKSSVWPKLESPGTDVKNMRKLLRSRGYTEFRTLVDTNDPERHAMPTEVEIREGIRWLIDDARPGDKLFLHYSGHGDQRPTEDSRETDGLNEAIVALGATVGSEDLIIDDELNEILVQPLPENCTLIAIFDCCHSGTMLDLCHKYPQYRLTRRNLKALWAKELVGRFARPYRRVQSLPALVMRHYRSPTVEVPAPVKPPPTRRGTLNPLCLPFFFPLPSTTDGPPQPLASGEPSTGSTPAQSLAHPPTGIFVDEPQASSTNSRRSTQNSNSISVPSRHTTILSLPRSSNDAGSVRWLAGSLTSTPKAAGFNHEQIAVPPSVQEDSPMSTPMGAAFGQDQNTVPPILRDFQTQMRAHTQVRSPTVEDPDRPRATIIAIAACHDEEEALDLDIIGGLLTSTFIECMERPENRDGVQLVDMISYLRDCFKVRTKRLHDSCSKGPLPKDGGGVSLTCACGLPIKAPEPLVTSSIKMMGNALIRL